MSYDWQESKDNDEAGNNHPIVSYDWQESMDNDGQEIIIQLGAMIGRNRRTMMGQNYPPISTDHYHPIPTHHSSELED